MFRPNSKEGSFVKLANERREAAYAVMKEKYKNLGPMTWHESWVLFLFLICTALWLLQSPNFIKGWGDAMSESARIPGNVTEAVIAKSRRLEILLYFVTRLKYDGCIFCKFN